MTRAGATRWRAGAGPFLAAIALALAACGPDDPRQAVLEERARWSVELQGFTQNDEAVQCRLKLAGPVNAELQKLTVRIELVDADERPLREVWEPIDVSGIRRGTPTEVYVRIAGPLAEVAAARAEIVLSPTEQEQSKIVELNV